MIQTSVPLLGIAARSGTGKTTLLSRILPLLRQRGLRVALIKHSHHDFDIDHPGKDSFRLRQAGAATVLLTSRYRRAIVTEFNTRDDPDLQTEIQALPLDDIDLILVEGFKHEAFPKIELHRAELGQALLYPNDPEIIALVSDTPLDCSLPQMDLNQPQQIVRFITDRILPNPQARTLP